ncbi:MAG: hypothetical protein H0W61_09355 [Bacteroidetes bacterium]|nr:hypothetical protein [Bacteroidota bacterium]
MKKTLIILYLIVGLTGYSQNPTYPNLASTLKHDTCLNKKFSIVFYLIQDSTYNLSVPNANVLNNIITNTITPFVNLLNATFKRICVSFANCSTVVIPNYPFNKWNQNIVDPVVTANWYTDKTINFYLPSQATSTVPNETDGYTYPVPSTSTTPAKDVIVVALGSLLTVNNANFTGSGGLHVVGHFFGLPNTFDEIGPTPTPPPPPGVLNGEFVDRTNCSTNGDGFCDTEADPYPQQFNSTSPPVFTCWFNKIPGQTDGKSKYYVPPVDNIMSNYGCRCKFTQEQYNRMAYVILKRRLYLH